MSSHASAGDLDKQIPAAASDPANPASSEVAVLAGGCFWGQQGLFEHVKGVTKVVAGYSGGERATAHYDLVSTGTTGHAESVQVTFDPHQVTFGQILRIYFSVAHDPTEMNRQGPDEGSQYRSEVFAASPEQASHRQGLYRPAGCGACFRQPHRHPGGTAEGLFMRRRIITRTIWFRIPILPTSSSTICPRSRP